MKKIQHLIIILMLMVSIASLAYAAEADDDNQGNPNAGNGHTNHPLDNETEREIGIMNNSLGARIRLLQLEKAILTNLLKGTMTVQVLKGLNISTTPLELVLENLSNALDAVRVADPAANDSVAVFVNLKNESRNLTKQFRDTLRVLLDNETIAMIKGQLRNITNDQLQNCSMRLRHWIRQFNMNQLYRLYGVIGETNTSLLEQYLNGNISLNQTKLQLHRMINQLTKEKRHMIFSEVKEANIKKKIHAQNAIEAMQNHGNGNGHGRHH
ncbi:MAG: hypothetical protein JW840_05955 [Candidatus Thermoplasmatota archaeon]|nr:hypothetical protein [Candidatus Thermoplasmatota archaeon]